MELTLFKVGSSGRVALGDLANGVEYYNVAPSSADGAPEGTLILTPVTIVAPTGKRAEATDTNTPVGDGDTPWDQPPV